MSSPGAFQSSTGVTWLSVALLLVVAVVASAGGVAAQAWREPPWEPEGPPVASAASRKQLAVAQQRAREVAVTRDKFTAQLAQERVNRVLSTVKLQSASSPDAVALGKSIRDTDLTITRLEDQVAATVRAGVDADHQVAVATDAVEKSRERAARWARLVTAADRLLFGLGFWLIAVAIGLVATWRHGKAHRTAVLVGSLIGLVAIRAILDVGWLVTAAIVAAAVLIWICRPVPANG